MKPLRALDSVVLVCRKCHQRKDAPAELDAKSLARSLKKAGLRAGRHPRIARVDCMGYCPKRAIAIAVAGEGLATRALAIEDPADAAEVFAGTARDRPLPSGHQ